MRKEFAALSASLILIALGWSMLAIAGLRGNPAVASIWSKVDPSAAKATKPISTLIRKFSAEVPKPMRRSISARHHIGALNMARFIVTAILAVALSPGSALAQVSVTGGAPTPSPLGMTSPLGLGAALPVAPTGIPLGATELIPPGTSPGTSPNGLATSDIAVCSGFGGSIPQASFGAPMIGTSVTLSTMGLATIFDGGNTGTASGTCAPGGSAALTRPTASASSPTGMAAAAPVGRVGIPMGSTELGAGGLSPAPVP